MTAVEARNLHYSYNGTKVLKDINLKIEDGGEFVAILGPNGAGKSTLLKCLSGILRCNGGVYISGRPIEKYSRNELARLIAYVPQRTEPGFMTVFDTVLLGRRPYMGLRPSKRDIDAVKNSLKKLGGIEHLALRSTRELSGGELQKVGIARALAQEPEIFMFDEPTNNLDIRSQLEVMKLARELSSEGKTVIMVMHEINLALRFAERFVFIFNGRVVADGGRDILRPALFREVYGTDVEIGEVRGIPVVVPL
ncbi:ABC transporter ATP-binding protein [Thermococcus peptonophilus]|uniref:ABC transporter ATP-binding protein n=1 Tax=Thermococcus peptonophilus TaxID=53952 RepID=UPI0006D27F15